MKSFSLDHTVIFAMLALVAGLASAPGLAFAQTTQGESSALSTLRSCLSRDAARLVSIPATTVGLRAASQIDALADILRSPIFGSCQTQITAAREIEPADAIQNVICDAIDNAMAPYLTWNQRAHLLARSRVCRRIAT